MLQSEEGFSVWPLSVWAFFVTGHFGLGTFRSRHFCT